MALDLFNQPLTRTSQYRMMQQRHVGHAHEMFPYLKIVSPACETTQRDIAEEIRFLVAEREKTAETIQTQ